MPLFSRYNNALLSPWNYLRGGFFSWHSQNRSDIYLLWHSLFLHFKQEFRFPYGKTNDYHGLNNLGKKQFYQRSRFKVNDYLMIHQSAKTLWPVGPLCLPCWMCDLWRCLLICDQKATDPASCMHSQCWPWAPWKPFHFRDLIMVIWFLTSWDRPLHLHTSPASTNMSNECLPELTLYIYICEWT